MRWDTDGVSWRNGFLILATVTAGCAFSSGDPWGRLEATLAVVMAPSPGRLDPDGRLVTALDYRVRLDRIVVQGRELEVFGTSGGGGDPAAAFDPAHPPEGYSLCHGGHCHAADGRLVPYEEITGSTGAVTEQTWKAIAWKEPTVEVPVGGRAPVVLGNCPEECALPEGTLSRVQVRLEAISVEGVAFDARIGTARRLPEQGVAFRGSVKGEVRPRAGVSEGVGPGHPLRVSLAATLSIPETLLDGVDFAALPRDGEFLDLRGAASSIQEALSEDANLQVETAR